MAVSEDPRDWLGRGFENVPGKSFGWAHNMERRALEEHLISRGYAPGSVELFFRVSKVQMRLHKYKPTFRQRQEAARARGERWVSPPPAEAPEAFTVEELERLRDLFDGGNDPVTAEIGRKARALLLGPRPTVRLP